MQALTRTLFPCYAWADAAMVERAAAFLERGADVRVFLEEGGLEPGADLAAKAREGRMADLVLVFFSRASLPPRWPRSQWEGALVTEPAAEGVRIAFVRCDDCVPPRVLAPLFEAVRLRDIKRWVRGSAPGETAAAADSADLEVLGIAIADRAGKETTPRIRIAGEFARVFRPDFDAVIRLETGDRRLAALAGDLGAQLGLRLESGLPENLERLRAFCEARRLLIVHEGGEVPELVFGGQTSTLVCEEAGEPSPDPLRPIHAVFDTAEDWAVLCQAARQAPAPRPRPGTERRIVRSDASLGGHGPRARGPRRAGRSRARNCLDPGRLGPNRRSTPRRVPPLRGSGRTDAAPLRFVSERPWAAGLLTWHRRRFCRRTSRRRTRQRAASFARRAQAGGPGYRFCRAEPGLS